ncbi:MAG: hypothetical protein AAFX44_14395 [Pseudomonadota bacterium]
MQSAHILAFLIILTIFGSMALRDYFKYRSRAERDREDLNEADDLNARIDLLEERVRTLEKIVTDPRDDLSRKINSL